jgi:hypothetical protein
MPTEMALLPVTDETWSRARRACMRRGQSCRSLSRWVVGIAYMYSFAASIARNVRRVLRPGVLWFIRNPDDRALRSGV